MGRLLAAFLWVCAFPAIAEYVALTSKSTSVEVLEDRRPLQPGEFLSIQVREQWSGPSVLQIPADGMLSYSQLGPFNISGLTCLDLAVLIGRGMAKQEPFATLGGPAISVTRTSPPPPRVTEKPVLLKELDNVRKLKAGDHIGTRIWEDKREELRQIIADTGKINAPYVGLLKAAGRTCREFAEDIKRELEKNYFITATVSVRQLPPQQQPEYCGDGDTNKYAYVFVQGAVAKAGKHFLWFGGMRVSDLIREAGGIRRDKKWPRISIIRKTPNGNKSILVTARAALAADSEYDLLLRRDDFVQVE